MHSMPSPWSLLAVSTRSLSPERRSAKARGKTKPRAEATGVHYTPNHLVDLVLDEVLPWDGDEWDIRVLDPACGSGVFLVKAFQRLVHRWRNARGRPGVADLRRVLENNLFGVDKERHAVRPVASFSLYLAMCDEIEPKLVWQKNMSFPRLRDKRLVKSDFFAEDKDGFCTIRDESTYQLVVGNALGGLRQTPEEVGDGPSGGNGRSPTGTWARFSCASAPI